jgi:hypothetical protein
VRGEPSRGRPLAVPWRDARMAIPSDRGVLVVGGARLSETGESAPRHMRHDRRMRLLSAEDDRVVTLRASPATDFGAGSPAFMPYGHRARIGRVATPTPCTPVKGLAGADPGRSSETRDNSTDQSCWPLPNPLTPMSPRVMPTPCARDHQLPGRRRRLPSTSLVQPSGAVHVPKTP